MKLARTTYQLSPQSTFLPEYDAEIENLTIERNKTTRRYQRRRNLELKTLLVTQNRLIKSEVEFHKNTQWEKAIESLMKDRNRIWKLNCRLAGKKLKTFTTAIYGADGIKYTPQEKTNSIADSLELQF
ncbi:hypothetical protein PR048_026671 [Dryococelus australis]|uniref:Uncharacterized protein n=1 Tax=Dryococelus australis TaxID=614101 RepID=A0ABQ9GM07_9NEOP|nr:hypothetical protein PR048_026671 [Dryococelus australis]